MPESSPKELAVIYRKPGSLKCHPDNPRVHSDDQIAQIVGSIQEFGFIRPVLLDGKSMILAGHGAVLAATALGIDKIPTVDVSGLTREQKLAYVIADNQLATNSSWDPAILKDAFEGLAASAFDLDLLGFKDFELKDILLQANFPDVTHSSGDDIKKIKCPECGHEFIP